MILALLVTVTPVSSSLRPHKHGGYILNEKIMQTNEEPKDWVASA